VVDTVDGVEYFFLVKDRGADGGAAGDAMWEHVRPRNRLRYALVLSYLPKDYEEAYGLFVIITEERKALSMQNTVAGFCLSRLEKLIGVH
jgi:hypothetical protein